MANDNDTDSWDLKQDESVRLSCKNGLRLTTSKFNRTDQLTTHKENGLPNGLCCYNRPISSRSGPEVRFINPAIYAESFDADESVEVQAGSSRSALIADANCDDFTLADRLSALSINEESSGIDFVRDQPPTLSDTYRCQFDTSPTSSLMLIDKPKSVTRVKRRCVITDKNENQYRETPGELQAEVQRYTLNGHRVVQFSTTSLSSSTISERRPNGVTLARKIAHEEWVQKKQRAALKKKEAERQIELKKQTEEERIAREKEERERRERENFLRWAERKRKEESDKREVLERELELQRRLKEVEDRAAMAKTIHLRQWARKKHEEQKAQQKAQQLKQRLVDEERRKRLEESSKAYERWREKLKNRPRPATQGLLPHQTATPTYVNPKPWQQIVDDASVESQKDSSGRKSIDQPKNSVRKSIASHQ